MIPNKMAQATEKPLSDGALGYKISAENWREAYFKLLNKQAEAVQKLKEELPCFLTSKQELGAPLFNTHKIIDRIFGEFHSPPVKLATSSQEVKGVLERPSNFKKAPPEDTHARGCGKTIKRIS